MSSERSLRGHMDEECFTVWNSDMGSGDIFKKYCYSLPCGSSKISSDRRVNIKNSYNLSVVMRFLGNNK